MNPIGLAVAVREGIEVAAKEAVLLGAEIEVIKSAEKRVVAFGKDVVAEIKDDYHKVTDYYSSRKRGRTEQSKRAKTPGISDDVMDIADEDPLANVVHNIEGILNNIEGNLDMMIDDKAVARSLFNMPRYGKVNRYRSKRSRGGRMKKKVTNRGVKAILKNAMTWMTDGFSKYESSDASAVYSQLAGNGFIPATTVPPILPGLIHNSKGYYQSSWLTRSQIVVMRTAAQGNIGAASGVTGFTGDPATLKFHFKKPRVVMEIHNPVTEIVKVRAWLFQVKENSNLTVFQNWQSDAQDLRTPSYPGAGVALNQIWSTSPFAKGHQKMKQHYKLAKKWHTLFTPGQTKKLTFKMKGGTYSVGANEGTEEYMENMSYFFLIETQGIPTHQFIPVGGTLPTNNPGLVGYSASGLEFCTHFTCSVAYSAPQQRLEQIQGNNVLSGSLITSASSLIPENEGIVRTV